MKRRFSTYLPSILEVAKQHKAKGLITAFLSGAEFSQLIKPLGTRPLVLIAHPGEEAMALGGTIASYAALQTHVTILTFTRGLHGTNTGKKDPKLGSKRRKEQLKGFKALEAEIKPIFWTHQESFPLTNELVFSLLEIIDDLNPDIVYTPSLFDNNPDSQTISLALASVLARLPNSRLRKMWIAQYELWTPIIPNKVLNIDDTFEQKQKAIECHESQLLCRDYLGAMIGINRYRAAILGAGSAAEAFFISRANQYIAFVPKDKIIK